MLSLGIDGSKFVGDGVEINQNLSISTPGPIAVDSIGRNVYWYSHSDHLIYSRSLQVGTKQVTNMCVCVCIVAKSESNFFIGERKLNEWGRLGLQHHSLTLLVSGGGWGYNV